MRRLAPWLTRPRPAPSVVRSWVHAAPVRALATGAPGWTSAQREKAAALESQMEERLRRRSAELEALFPGSDGHEAWAWTYYRHQRVEFLVAALQRFWADELTFASAARQAFLLGFLSQVLETLSPEETNDLVVRLFLHKTVLPQSILASLRLCRSDASSRQAERISDLLAKADHARVAPLTELIRRAPVAAVESWAFPHADPAFTTGWVTKAHPLDLVPLLGELKHQSAATAQSGAPVDATTTVAYAVNCGLAVVDANWGAFAASGHPRFLRRLCDAASAWAEFADRPHAVEFLLRSDVALPEDIDGVFGDGAADPDRVARALRFHTARAALMGLLQGSRRHPAILQTVCAVLGETAPAMVETPAGPEVAADSTNTNTNTTAAAAAAAAAATASSPLSSEEVRRRATVFPPLIHLMGRAFLGTVALEAPRSEGEADVRAQVRAHRASAAGDAAAR